MFRHDSATEWHTVPMKPIGNDRWRAEFTVQQLGRYQYSRCAAWVDHLRILAPRNLVKKYEAGQDIDLDLRTGALLAREQWQSAHTVRMRSD